MKPEDLEDIKNKYDYCIIPTRKIERIEPPTVVYLKGDSDGDDRLMQFVNSGYFKITDWGKE